MDIVHWTTGVAEVLDEDNVIEVDHVPLETSWLLWKLSRSLFTREFRAQA